MPVLRLRGALLGRILTSCPGSDREYSGQSGAFNESVSDVFGSLVKQWVRGEHASEADWLIGVGFTRSKARARIALDEGAGHRVR